MTSLAGNFLVVLCFSSDILYIVHFLSYDQTVVVPSYDVTVYTSL